MFVNNTKCFQIIKDPNDLNQFHCNIKKCERLVITHKKDVPQYSYSLGNHTIWSTNNQTDLGIIVSKDVKWKDHTARVVGKTYQMLDFIHI